MRTVRADDGSRYLLRKRSSNASLVLDPATGDERYIDNARLERCDESQPLETVGSTVSDRARAELGVSDDRALGLLVVIDRHDPIAAVDLVEFTELCESDLNGQLTELRAGGLVEPVSNPVLGYETTPLAHTKLDRPSAEE